MPKYCKWLKLKIYQKICFNLPLITNIDGTEGKRQRIKTTKIKESQEQQVEFSPKKRKIETAKTKDSESPKERRVYSQKEKKTEDRNIPLKKTRTNLDNNENAPPSGINIPDETPSKRIKEKKISERGVAIQVWDDILRSDLCQQFQASPRQVEPEAHFEKKQQASTLWLWYTHEHT